MVQLIYDKLNSFGQADLSGADVEFPDTIDLVDAQVDRMTVDIKIVDAPAAGGTSVAGDVVGSDDSAFCRSETLGIRSISLADLNAGRGSIAISPNRYRYLKVTFTKSGTFTVGMVEAIINSYLGK